VSTWARAWGWSRPQPPGRRKRRRCCACDSAMDCCEPRKCERSVCSSWSSLSPATLSRICVPTPHRPNSQPAVNQRRPPHFSRKRRRWVAECTGGYVNRRTARGVCSSEEAPVFATPKSTLVRQRVVDYFSDGKVANRNGSAFGWGIAHATVSRRPPIPLCRNVARSTCTRTPRRFGNCPSFKDHFLPPRATP
jgi:hypothetical protein